jgi:hypothetical protein
MGEGTSGTNWVGIWLDLRACLDALEKRKTMSLLGIEHIFLGR